MVAETEDLPKQDGTNLVDQPVLHSICKAGSPINLGPLQINQQTKKVPYIAKNFSWTMQGISVF